MNISHNFQKKKPFSQSDNQPYPQKVIETLGKDSVFNFPDGILAFEDSKRFVILLNSKIKPFIYFKSLDIQDLGFVCIDPFKIYPEYSIDIPAKELSLLGLKDPSNAFVLNIVTVNTNPQKTTTNLLAPIIINITNNTGRQVVLEEKYPVKFKIWDSLEKHEKTLREE